VRFSFGFPLCHFPWARLLFFLGQAWAEGKRGACSEPPLRGLRTGNGLYIWATPLVMI